MKLIDVLKRVADMTMDKNKITQEMFEYSVGKHTCFDNLLSYQKSFTEFMFYELFLEVV